MSNARSSITRVAAMLVLVAACATGAGTAANADEDYDLEMLDGLQKKVVAAFEGKNYDEGIRIEKQAVEAVDGTTLSDAKKRAYRTLCYYNLACGYSLKKEKATALDWLEKAVQGGFNDWDQLAKDSDLDGIRDEARFKRIIARGKGEKVDEERDSEKKAAGAGTLTANEAEAARLFRDAESAYESGKFDDACDLLGRAIDKDPFPSTSRAAKASRRRARRRRIPWRRSPAPSRTSPSPT